LLEQEGGVKELLAVEPAMFVGTLDYVLYGVLLVCLVLLLAKRKARKAKAKM
jgi:hypothetical protein